MPSNCKLKCDIITNSHENYCLFVRNNIITLLHHSCCSVLVCIVVKPHRTTIKLRKLLSSFLFQQHAHLLLWLGYSQRQTSHNAKLHPSLQWSSLHEQVQNIYQLVIVDFSFNHKPFMELYKGIERMFWSLFNVKGLSHCLEKLVHFRVLFWLCVINSLYLQQ